MGDSQSGVETEGQPGQQDRKDWPTVGQDSSGKEDSQRKPVIAAGQVWSQIMFLITGPPNSGLTRG